MGYVEDYGLFADDTNDLHKKVAKAIDIAARDVIAESPATEYHAQRLQWAVDMRDHPDKVLDQAHKYMMRVLDNTTVAAAGNTATDNDVQFVINGLVNTMAGV